MREAVEHEANNARSSVADRVLLTGARGFLGSEIARQLAQLSIKTTVTSRSAEVAANGSDESLSRSVAADLCSESIPDQMFDGVRQVIHTAGLAHQFGDRAHDAEAFEQLNNRATERLVQSAINHGVKHFVLVSTVAVYGDGSEDGRCTEQTDCVPQGPYAVSKYGGEQAAIRLAQDSGMRLTVLRMTTIYGEGDRGNTDRLLRAIDAGRFVSIGNGQNVKSLIHLRDAARACVAVLDGVDDRQSNDDSNVNVYNVSAEPVPMAGVVSGLSGALGKQPSRWYLPATPIKLASGLLATLSGGRGRLARIHQTILKWLKSDIVDASKFRDRFGFKSEVSLPQGLIRQVQGYRRNHPFGGRVPFLKRAFDFVLAVLLCLAFAIPMFFCYLAVRLTSKGPAIYWSQRVGIDQRPFWMAKFRSMRTDTPTVATHLLTDSKSFITPVGRVMRKTSLDELPQLWNIIKGEMSFVGPRPALESQMVVNKLRAERGVARWLPGITGWAQINGRDELKCEEKVEFDYQYCQRWSLLFDLRIIVLTAWKVFAREGVTQAGEESAEVPPMTFRNASPQSVTRLTLSSTVDALASASAAVEQLEPAWGPVRLIGLRSAEQFDGVLDQQTEGHRESVLVTRVDSAHHTSCSSLALPACELSEVNRQAEVDAIVAHVNTMVAVPQTQVATAQRGREATNA